MPDTGFTRISGTFLSPTVCDNCMCDEQGSVTFTTLHVFNFGSYLLLKLQLLLNLGINLLWLKPVIWRLVLYSCQLSQVQFNCVCVRALCVRMFTKQFPFSIVKLTYYSLSVNTQNYIHFTGVNLSIYFHLYFCNSSPKFHHVFH